MKQRLVLSVFLSLFIINISAQPTYEGGFCHFKGMPNTNFEMLLEKNTPNFYAISQTLGIILQAKTEDLKNPDCELKKYTEELLEFYKTHKDEIKNSNKDVANIIEKIQKKLDNKNEL